MASYILPILFIAAVFAVSLCIGYVCVELLVRLIGRGLGAGTAEGLTHQPAKFKRVAFR